ncbi:MAG: acyl-CoA dehydrogenase family protein [Pseudomonadota bacterium]
MQVISTQGIESKDYEQLLVRVHEIGRTALAPAAADVDAKARFPEEAITALKEAKLLSGYVPAEYGGMGLSLAQMARVCETLGQYCGNAAMVFAMHQVIVACIVHHCASSEFFQNYLRRVAKEQRLIASATTEIGTGGDLRSSICAVEVNGDRFTLAKQAPVISYGAAADDLMITCRRTAESPASDQVQVLALKGEYQLAHTGGWDTMGFRGTCSDGYNVTSNGAAQQIQPEPFDVILARTMHPCAHILWGSLWVGIAIDAVNRARSFVRAQARKNPSATQVSALRLAEVDTVLQELRHNMQACVGLYQEMLRSPQPEAFNNLGFSIRINNLKLACSERLVEIVSRAMLICGIAGYRNDSPYSLARHLRDAYGAALMVNNDRIRGHNATLLTIHKEI